MNIEESNQFAIQEMANAADELAVKLAEKLAEINYLEGEMRRILNVIPACHNGRYFIEHHDGEGNVESVEDVDPSDIIQSVSLIAWETLNGSIDHGGADGN